LAIKIPEGDSAQSITERDRHRPIGPSKKLIVLIELSPMEAEHGQDYLSRDPALSVPDAFALALARARAWTLVTGDRRLRQMAQAAVVPVHGLLWLFEQLANEGADCALLSAGLARVLEHPLCRLPRPEAGGLLAKLRAR